MKFTETTFDLLKIDDECFFRNEFGIIVHGVKVGADKIKHKKSLETVTTGYYHKVFLIDDSFDKRDLRIKWFLEMKPNII